jgi:hypothetical protein
MLTQTIVLSKKKKVLASFIILVMVLSLVITTPGTVTVMADTLSSTNIAQGKTATQSSTAYSAGASRAVDGNTDGNYGNSSVTHTDSDAQAWWMVDLGSTCNIGDIKVYNRTDACMDRLNDYNIIILDANNSQVWTNHQTAFPNPSTTVSAGGVNGRYVKVQLTGTNNLSLAEVQVYQYTVVTNAALCKTVTQSSTAYGGDASRAVDGRTDGNFSNNSVSHTNYEEQAWWMVDLGYSYNIADIMVYNRTDACMDRLSNYNIIILDANNNQVWTNHQTAYPNPSTTVNAGGVTGRYVKIQLTGTNYLSLTEVQVYGVQSVDLQPYFNADGFSYDTSRDNGDYDGHGYTYSADLVNSVQLYDDVYYNLGSKTNGVNNTINCSGQTIALSQGHYDSIRILGSATDGDQTGSFRVNYTDSTYSDVSVTMRNWCSTGTSDKIVQTMAHRHSATSDANDTNYIFAYYIDTAGEKTVQSITLPNNSNMHVLSMVLTDTSESYLSHASSVIMQRGLVFGCWLNPDTNDLTTLPTADEYAGLNFNNPQFNNPPNAIYSTALMSGANANNTWGLTKAPFYYHLDDSQYPLTTTPVGADFLTSEQQQYADKLYSIQFGDEESGNQWNPRAALIKQWFDQTRSLYPDTIVNTNQYEGQCSENDLEALSQNTAPDVLTYDIYYYSNSSTSDIDANSRNLSNLGKYRKAALGGWDGTGRSPIAFGQYVLGDTGSYYYTESESYAVPFITLAAGGKWLSYFLWMYDSNHQYLVDQSRQKTPYYYIWSEVAKEARNLGNHLVNLTSTDVRILPGQNNVKNPGVTQENPMPDSNYVPRFSANSAYYITNMAATNLGTKNSGLPGDVVIGYFKPMPGASSFFSTANPKYFMVVNGLTSGGGTGGCLTGASSDTAQEITITFDMGATGDPAKLKKVNRTNGNTESVSLTHVSGTTYTLDLTIDGGQGELLFWAE